METAYRILVIDDNPAIYQDIIKILAKNSRSSAIDNLEMQILDVKQKTIILPKYEIDSASQGQVGVELISRALRDGRPYAMAFVDIRMPPGWDGVETIERMWNIDNSIQVVICTAYSDYSWEETIERLGGTNNLMILKKPFDNVVVQQLVFALVQKWEFTKKVNEYSHSLEETAEQRRIELDEFKALMQATFNSTSDGILAIDNNKKIVDYNQKFADLMNISPHNTLKNTNSLDYLYSQFECPKECLEKITNSSIKSDLPNYDIIKFKNGRIFELYSRYQILNNKIIGNVLCFRDVTQRIHDEEKIRYQETHDHLTKVSNRTMVFERLQQAIAHANHSKTNFAVLFLNLDRFKVFNDSLGDKAGDLLLRKIALRLNNAIRKQDTIARMGGDEFAVIIENVITQKNVSNITNKLLATLNRPFYILQREIVIYASIGVSLYSKEKGTGNDLLKNAIDAMHYAKKLGGNNFKFYSPKMDQQSSKYFQMEVQLKQALNKNEFTLFYQPQFNLLTGEVNGAEALLRWNHDGKGLISPLDFISFAEKTGLILPMGEWILRTAFKQVKLWQEMKLPFIRVAINISGAQLTSKNFISVVKKLIKETEVEPKCLEFELTESILINEDIIINSLKELRKMNIQIALDDFGTGYSSLSYLKKIPINRIKIDRSFIHNIQNDKEKKSIARAIMTIAASLNLKVIAEGIETKSELNFLKSLGCEEGQGFFLSKPLSPELFTLLL